MRAINIAGTRERFGGVNNDDRRASRSAFVDVTLAHRPSATRDVNTTHTRQNVLICCLGKPTRWRPADAVVEHHQS